MIDLRIKIENGKIGTIFKDEEVVMGEASMLSFELDRIKLLLLEKEWNSDFKFDSYEVEKDD